MSSESSNSVEGVILTPNHTASAPRANVPERDVPMQDALHRFLGGSPGAVFLRLAVASLIVGFFLVWLNIRPYDLFFALERFVRHLWEMGFDAVREVGQYVLAGAVLVVPLWLLSRLLKTTTH